MTSNTLRRTSALTMILILLMTPALSSADPAAAESDWVLRTPTTAPSMRFAHAMTYDSARGVTVLFGGWDGSTVFSDTWEWDGNDWLLREPATTPGPRLDHAMAYDAARGVTVMFAGTETWEWDGTDWVQRTPATSPLQRVNPSMAYDSAREVTVMFGGNRYDAGQVYLDETWEWDGTNWTLRTPATLPPGRMAAGMAYDAARGVTVLFGGYWQGGFLGDTWEWDGTDWAQAAPATAPTSRYGTAMTFDSARGVTLLFGGFEATSYEDQGDTWEWNGTDWTQRVPAAAPAGREFHAMAYDSARGVTVLFGGTNSPNDLVNETWEYPISTPTYWYVYGPLILRSY